MSQGELARAAGVAPRTVAQVEREGTSHAEVIIKLSVATAQDPADWLRRSGHPVLLDRIEKVLAERRAANLPSTIVRVSPESHFGRMADRIKAGGGPALFCSFVTSDVPITNKALFPVMEQLFEAGMYLALVCPFPQSQRTIDAERPRLSGYYGSAYKWALLLAKDLQAAFDKYADRISLFFPQYTNEVTLIAPPVSIVEVRPGLVRFGHGSPAAARYELGAYIRYPDGRDDEWIRIHDDQMGWDNGRGRETLGLWQDYAADIFAAWDPGKTPAGFDDKKLVFWRRTGVAAIPAASVGLQM